MEETIKILYLVDDEHNAVRVQSELRQADIAVLLQRVDTREAFKQALNDFKPDLVLSDYVLLAFDGMSAMSIVRETYPNLPFIFISWVIHEQSVIEALKKGATDYVFMDQLSHLPLSLHRALREYRERKALDEAHAQIQARELHFRSLIENASDLIMVLTREGKIDYASPSVFKVLGYDIDSLIGEYVMDYVLEDDKGFISDLFASQPKTIDKSIVFRFLHKNGSWRSIEAFWKIASSPDRAEFAVLNARDITDRQKEQEALKESIIRHLKMQTELQKTQKKIIEQERLGAIGQMASGIAHDFSNSLMPVLGFSEILLNNLSQKNEDPESVKKYLEIINSSAKDAMNIIGRLREFYRTKEKADSLRPTDVNKVIEQVILMTQPRWREESLAGGVAIQVHLEPGEIPQILANETALKEAFINLVFNAVDAMPFGGEIIFKTKSEGNDVVIEVSDTGTGMSEEAYQRCFEPFFTTKGKSGTGLGLAMVYGVVRRHEGSIDVKSKLGKGTTFYVRIPIKKYEKDLNGHFFLSSTVAAPKPIKKLSVLVVDDEPAVREVLKGYLGIDGHSVETAKDGKEGFEIFKSGVFDLVFTDRAMPEMNGDQLAEKIKAHSPKTPVIMLTGFGELMKAKGENPKGVDIVLSKPLTITAYREAISRFFSA